MNILAGKQTKNTKRRTKTNGINLFKTLGSLFYDLILIISLIVLLSFPYVYFFKGSNIIFFRIYILIIIYSYYAYFICKTGQTPGMLSWKLKLILDDPRNKISFKTFNLRLVLFFISNVFLGVGFLWSFVDIEKQTLYDRLAKLKLVKYK